MTMTPEDNYVPFGLEWEKEIMKMNKQHIVLMYKKACIAKKQLEADLASSATPAGDGWRWVKVSDKHPDTYDWPELHYRLDGKKSNGILIENESGGPVFEYKDHGLGHYVIVEDLSRIEWLCEAPKNLDAGDGWVSVEERMPEVEEATKAFPVIIVCEGFAASALYAAGKFFLAYTWSEEGITGEHIDGVTHWQPLPAPPVK